MGLRLQFQEMLETLLDSSNVYFQPPPDLRMNYPAIVYFRDQIDVVRADNLAYLDSTAYTVTVIDRDPDSPLAGRLAQLPLSTFSRHYVMENLNHDVFTIYF